MYVITGATGHTGTIAAQSLLSRGHVVRVVGRSADRLRHLTSAGAEAFVGDLADAEKLTQVFQGAQGVYVLVPPNLTSSDYRSYQDQVSSAVATAIVRSKVKFVVALSSIGADKTVGTGPVVGLHNLEQKLNQIDGANVLHLRPGYFMENTLAQVGAIRAFGVAGGPLRPDLKVAMIATRDIGPVVAEALIQLDFKGKQTRELLGQRDLTMVEATAIIAKAIGKPDLSYSQLPDEQFIGAVMKMGMSQNLASLIAQMAGALNSGHMKALEPRSARNTTPTSYETFVAEVFAPAFRQQAAA
jgi:uncharacterized protein YbjT (DUF2867 family)